MRLVGRATRSRLSFWGLIPDSFALMPLLATLIVAGRPAVGQLAAGRQPLAQRLAGTRLATKPPWIFLIGHPTRVSSNSSSSLTEQLCLGAASAGHRVRHGVIGGLIGAATGVITRTVISSIVKGPGTGFSTCDAKAYVGFGLGAFIGALVKYSQDGARALCRARQVIARNCAPRRGRPRSWLREPPLELPARSAPPFPLSLRVD